MRIEFVSRGVVCLAAMPPSTLDVAAFETATGLDRALTQVINPQLAVADYGRLRLVVVPGQPSNQIQLEAPGNVNRELCRTAATELIRQATPYALRGLGFNGYGKISCEDEEDPVRALLNEAIINERLGTELSRAGIKLVFPMDGARATLDISPPADEDPASWGVSINRHYAGAPDDDERARAISWFAALNDELPRAVGRLIRAQADEVEDVA